MVDMTHDRYDWRAQFEILRIINNLWDFGRIDIWWELLTGNTKFRCHERCRIEINLLIDGSHNPHHEELLHDICRRIAHLGGQILYSNTLWKLDMFWTGDLHFWCLWLIATTVITTATTIVVPIIAAAAIVIAVIAAASRTAAATMVVATAAASAIIVIAARIAIAGRAIAAASRSGRAVFGTGSRCMTLASVIAAPVIAGCVVVTAIAMIIIAAIIIIIMTGRFRRRLCFLLDCMRCRIYRCIGRCFSSWLLILKMFFQGVTLLITNTTKIIFHLEILLLQDVQNVFTLFIEFFC